jgi:hypothetical protein
LSFRLPPGLVQRTNENNGYNILIEYISKSETFDNWTRMVTIQAYRGLGRSPATTAKDRGVMITRFQRGVLGPTATLAFAYCAATMMQADSHIPMSLHTAPRS